MSADLAILADRTLDILGAWIEQTDGATFWIKVFTDLKAPGCEDMLIADALCDGHSRHRGRLSSRQRQTCLVHLRDRVSSWPTGRSGSPLYLS